MRSNLSSTWLLLGLACAGWACSSADDGEPSNEIPEFGGLPGPGSTSVPGATLTPNAPGSGDPGSGDPGSGDPGSGDPNGAASNNGATPVAGGMNEGQNGGTLAPSGQGAPADGNGGTPAGAPATPGAPADAPSAPGTVPPGTPLDGATPANFFTTGAWRGLVTTATRVTGTSINPATFEAHTPGSPFCVEGSVQRDPQFLGEATLIFNLAQDATVGAQTEPAAVAPTGDGIAVTFARATGAPLRLELTGPAGTWCYELPVVQGQAFAPYSEFNTTCWDAAGGQPYRREPVTSLGFEVPGRAAQDTGYDFCVAGFADAASAAQAPPVPANFLAADVAGTLSEKFGRAIVTGEDGKKYIVSNNAWSDVAQEGSQVINYVNNSFTIMSQQTGGAGSQVLTFPFISVGRNGARGGNDSQTTTLDDNLPIQISQIGSVQTRFSHNVGQGGVQGSDFNATYDVWFAAQPPTGDYGTASGAFLMVWTHIPPGRTPIGQVVADNINLQGRMWRLFVGRRDEGLAANGEDGASPVISYVSQGTVNDYEFDLNAFIRDAVQRASTGGLRGLAFGSNLFLTDVFAGFEIWSGGTGLRVNEFTADVQRR